MKTVATILELAAPLQAGFHIRIENEPWMTLVIEDRRNVDRMGCRQSPLLIMENRTAI